MRRVLPLAIAVALTAAAAGAGATPSVRRIVLSPAQVGVGYRMSVIPGGNLVKGQVTLDLCGSNFPSERLRLARLQVVYAKRGVAIELSNEVVGYRPGGARQALREVTRAVDHCPAPSHAAGVSSWSFRLTKVTDPRLLRGYLAVRERFAGVYKGKRFAENAVLVYQARGDVFSGVYAAGGTLAPLLTLALHAAEESAKNLRQFA